MDNLNLRLIRVIFIGHNGENYNHPCYGWGYGFEEGDIFIDDISIKSDLVK